MKVGALWRFLVSCIIISSLYSCSNEDETDPVRERLNLLTKTWEVKTVRLDGVLKDEYSDFEIILEENNTSSVFSYQVSGRPSLSPWQNQGSWRFGDDITTQIIRDPGTPDEVLINYSINDNELVLNFSFEGDGYSSSRTDVIAGQWQFVFIPQ
jgi:hypothetical protein